MQPLFTWVERKFWLFEISFLGFYFSLKISTILFSKLGAQQDFTGPYFPMCGDAVVADLDSAGQIRQNHRINLEIKSKHAIAYSICTDLFIIFDSIYAIQICNLEAIKLLVSGVSDWREGTDNRWLTLGEYYDCYTWCVSVCWRTDKRNLAVVAIFGVTNKYFLASFFSLSFLATLLSYEAIQVKIQA